MEKLFTEIATDIRSDLTKLDEMSIALDIQDTAAKAELMNTIDHILKWFQYLATQLDHQIKQVDTTSRIFNQERNKFYEERDSVALMVSEINKQWLHRMEEHCEKRIAQLDRKLSKRINKES